MKALSLEDARTIVQKFLPDMLHSAVYRVRPRWRTIACWDWNPDYAFKLELVIFQFAVHTVQRHLPAPLFYHTFKYHVRIGRLRAAGARFIPYP